MLNKDFNLRKQGQLKYIPILSLVGLLGILTLAFVAPTFIPGNVKAIEYGDIDSGNADKILSTYVSDSNDVGSNAMSESNMIGDVSNLSSISVSIPSSLSLDIKPTASGEAVSTSGDLIVAAVNVETYRLYIATDNGNAELENLDRSISAAIKPALSRSTLSNLPVNTWGYSVRSIDSDGDAMYGVTSNTTIPELTASPSTTVAADKYNFAVGAKVDMSLPAGTYANTIVISAVADPVKLGLAKATYMQDMTSDICKEADIHDTKQLIDSRDNKLYWVTKLKDGNCWMTQNLALDLNSTTLPLVAASSNLDTISSWSPNRYTNAQPLNGVSDLDTTKQFSWNLGKIVNVLPMTNVNCNGLYSDFSFEQQCSYNSFIDVSGSDWQPTFVAQAGSFRGSEYPLVALDETNKTYDPHYLIGNYYYWGTANAGADLYSGGGSSARNSICAKGWELPLTGGGTFTLSKTWPDLLRNYGLASSELVGVPSNGEYNTTTAPLYLNYPGGVNMNYGFLESTGNTGFFWSKTTGSRWGYYMSVSPSNVAPSKGISTVFGFSVRCVAK